MPIAFILAAELQLLQMFFATICVLHVRDDATYVLPLTSESAYVSPPACQDLQRVQSTKMY